MWEFLSQNLRNKISVTDFLSRIWGMRETNTNSKLESGTLMSYELVKPEIRAVRPKISQNIYLLFFRNFHFFPPSYLLRVLSSPFRSLSPSRNSDPGSHAYKTLLPPLKTLLPPLSYGSCLYFVHGEKTSAVSSLVDSRRIVPTHDICRRYAFHQRTQVDRSSN